VSIKFSDVIGIDRHGDSLEPCDLDLRLFGPKINPIPGFLKVIICTKFGDSRFIFEL